MIQPINTELNAYKNKGYSPSESPTQMNIDKELSPIPVKIKEIPLETRKNSIDYDRNFKKYSSSNLLDEDEKPLCIHEDYSDEEIEANNKIESSELPSIKQKLGNSLKLEVRFLFFFI